MMQTAFLILQSVVLVGCLAAWVVRLRVQRTEGALLPGREHAASPVGAFDIFVTVSIWFFFQLAGLLILPWRLGVPLTEMTAEHLGPEQTLEVNGWAGLLQFLGMIAAIFYLIQRHRTVTWLGQKKWLVSDFYLGMVGSLMLIPVVMLIQAVVTMVVEYRHPTIDSLVENFSATTAMWAWIGAVGIAPVTEEFFFRGIIQGWLQRVFDFAEPKEKWLIGGPVLNVDSKNEQPSEVQLRFWVPILFTSILFAGVHAGQGPAPIPLFFLSMGIGYLFRRSGSLVPCVIVHLVLNSIAMTILTLSIIFPELAPADPAPAPGYLIWN